MSGPLIVAVDWDKNGNYTTVGDDVTDRVRGSIQAQFGREQDTSLTQMTTGRGSFNLDNTSRAYSPRNTLSPLFGKVKPARPVLVTRLVGATTYTIFAGHTDDTPINPDSDSKQVSLSLVDGLADFKGQTISTQLYQGLRTGAAIDAVLTAAGWTGGRDLDTGATVIPWFWAEGTDVFDLLQQLVASEGPPALLTIGPAGEVVFRDRHHRLTRTASTVSQSTWRGDGQVEPVMSRGYTYDDAWRNIVNFVSISVDERQPSGDLTPVWSTDEVIGLSAFEVRTVVMQTSDPFFAAITPAAGTDYILLSGSLSSVVLSRTSGASTSVTLTASGSGATIQGLALRATSVPVTRTWQITNTNSASIADYGQRSIPSDPVWASRQDAQDIADLFILQRAQPLPILSVRFVCGLGQDTRLAALLAMDLSDRVTIIEPETGLASIPFFVESITHTVDGLTNHEIVFGVEAVPTSPTSSFILNTSVLNGAVTLGY